MAEQDIEWEIEWGKLVLSSILLIGGFALVLTGSKTEGVGIITAVMGYVFGNGRLASKGKPSQPMIGGSRPPELYPPPPPPAA